MRIGVDSRPLREKQTSGIPMYVRNLLEQLARLDHENEYVLYAHKSFDFPIPNHRWSKRYGAATRYGSVWMQAELPLWLRRDKIDIFWGTQHILPLLMPKRIKAILTVHDLVHQVFPETMKILNYYINKFVIPPSIERTDVIVAISKWTLKDVLTYLNPEGKLMFVNHLGVGKQFYPRDREAAARRVHSVHGIRRPYLLTVGTFEPRKNIQGTIKAFARIADRIPHHLALVGQKGWKTDDLDQLIHQSSIRDRIHPLGYVSDDVLPDIYAAADAFIFPSLYEGFGLPPLEAMASAVPVVCSNVSSIPEIVGDAALLVNPNSPEEIAEGIVSVVENKELRDRLIDRGLARAGEYTWEKTARRMMDIYPMLSPR